MNNTNTTMPAECPHRFRPLPLIALAIAIVTIFAAHLYVFNPSTTAWYPHCVFRTTTGWLCPGCGGLRAIHALLHGRILNAFLLNPLLFAAFALIPVALFRRHWLLQPRFAWICFAVVLLFFLARNLPWLHF